MIFSKILEKKGSFEIGLKLLKREESREGSRDPGSTPGPGTICCVSLPLSPPVTSLSLPLHYQVKPQRPKKKKMLPNLRYFV